MKANARVSRKAISLTFIVGIGSLPCALTPATANDLKKAWHSITHPSAKHAEKAAKKAVKDVGNAGKAAAKFVDQQNRMVLQTAQGALRQKNIGKSLEFLAANPLRQTNANAKQALQSSPVLAAAATVAASAYGGPAGAAAFAAWTTYNATGDLSAALKVGVTQGLIAAASAGVADMPAGPEKIAAEASLKVTVSQATGGNSEEARQAALASLFSTAGNSVNAADLNTAERSLSMAAIGGAAVAASGGDREAIKNGFLQGGGKVLVQELKDANAESVHAAEQSAKAYVHSVLSDDQIAAANTTYASIKDNLTNNEVAQLITAARKDFEAKRAAIKDDVAQRTARLDTAHKSITDAKDRAARETARIDQQIASIRSDSDRRIAAAVQALREVVAEPVAVQKEKEASIVSIRSEADLAIAAAEASRQAIIAESEIVIAKESEKVRDDAVLSIRESLAEEKGPASQAILDDGTIVSWDASELKANSNKDTSVYLAQPKSASELLDFFFQAKDKEAM